MEQPESLPLRGKSRRGHLAGLARFTGLVQRQLGVPFSVVLADLADLPTQDLGVPVRSWVGVPVADADGSVRGYLCAIDDQPRSWTEAELETLRDLAAACATELALRDAERASARARLQAEDARLRAELAERHSRLLLVLSESLAQTTTVDQVLATVTRVAHQELRTLSCGVFLVDHDQRFVRLSATPGSSSWLPARYADIPLDAELPIPTAARTGRALFFEDAAAMHRAHPALGDLSEGVEFEQSAVVPLVSTGSSDGVLVLSWATPGVASRESRATLAALGRYSAQALERARLLQGQQEAVRTLQEALLTELPSPQGLELAASYTPAAAEHRVGGDWYDAFLTPAGDTVVVIGDVTGHDLEAAAAMGSLRSMLRALAHDRSDSPAKTVRRLDSAAVGLGGAALATLVCGKIQAEASSDGSRRVRWTNAGHPPPVVVTGDGEVRVLTTPPELLVGVRPSTQREDHVVDLPPGAVLLLYTDGLVERRGEDLSVGLQRLADAVAGSCSEPLADLLARLVDELAGAGAEDDVALIAVRVLPHAA